MPRWPSLSRRTGFLAAAGFFLLFLAVAILYGIFLSVAAILLEELAFRRYPDFGDLAKLILFGVLENFGFRQGAPRDQAERLRSQT